MSKTSPIPVDRVPVIRHALTTALQQRPRTRADLEAIDAGMVALDSLTKHSDLVAALLRAHELLAQCGGTALGIALSGTNHPNPDEKLEELFRLCNAECLAIGRLLNPPSKS